MKETVGSNGVLKKISISPLQKNTIELFSNNPERAEASCYFSGALDRGEIEQRLTKIVRASSALNEAYVASELIEGTLYRKSAETVISWLDWSVYDVNEIEIEKISILSENSKSFDLVQPFISLVCAALPNDRYWLSLSASPISVDTFSCFYILELLTKPSDVYAQVVLNRVDNSDVSKWLGEFSYIEEAATARKYWQEAFTTDFYDRSFRLKFAKKRPQNLWKTAELELTGSEIKKLSMDELGDTVFAILTRTLTCFGQKSRIARVFSSRADTDLSRFIGPLSKAVTLDDNNHQELSEQIELEKQNRELAFDMLESFFKPSSDRTKSFSFTYEVLDLVSSGISFSDLHLRYEDSLLAFTLVIDDEKRKLHIQYDENKIFLEPFIQNFKEELGQIGCDNITRKTISGEVCENRYGNVVEWLNDTIESAEQSCIEHSSGNQIHFRMLHGQANQFARFLAERLVNQGEVVAIVLPRSLDFLIAVFGTTIAGAAYLPLESDMPIRRMSKILEAANPKIIISEGEKADHLGEKCCIFSEINLSQYVTDNLEVSIKPDDLAYLIFTSGSTGAPKGVEITHRALMNHMQWMQDAYPLNSKDVVLHRTSIGFDASIWEYWSAILNDAKLVIIPNALNHDVGKMVQALCEHSVSVLQCVPSLLNLLLESNDFTKDQLSLRYLFCGGEALKMSLAERADKNLRCKIINLYGPSECCIDASSWVYKHGYQLEYAPIGRPINNLEFVIVGDNGEFLSVGEIGELYISGDSLFRGYYNDIETTDRAISIIESSRKRYYKTGDRVYASADGLVCFVGRTDTQFKVNGFRIEAAEIESVSKEIAGIAQAICLVDSENDQLLLALESPDELKDDQIKEQLSEVLPSYMVPNQVLVMKSFPLMANGKVDRKHILTLSKNHHHRVYVSPESLQQKVIADLWQKVLAVDYDVGIDDNFFSLGGDSISLIKFVFEASKLDIKLTVFDVLNSPTIRELDSKKLLGRDESRKNLSRASLNVDAKELNVSTSPDTKFSVSGMQQFMLMQVENDKSGLGIFQPQQVLYLDEFEISSGDLVTNLGLLFEYPNFKLRFTESEGKFSQFISHDSIPILVRDESSYEAAEISLSDYVLEDRKKGFNWRDVSEPLIRATLFNMKGKPYCLVLSNLHVIQDGWGNIEFFSKLISLMEGETPASILNSRSSAALTLKEFAHQDSLIRGDSLNYDFWKNTLATFANNSWSYSHPSKGRVIRKKFLIKPASVEHLSELAAREKIGVKDILIATCLRSLDSVYGPEHSSLGVVSNGRNEYLSDPLGTMGLFWNLVPVRGVDTPCLCSQGVNVNSVLSSVEQFKRYPINTIISMNGNRLPFRYTFNFVNFHKSGEVRESLTELKGNNGDRRGGDLNYDYFGFPIEFLFSSDVDGLHVSLQFQSETIEVSSVSNLINFILNDLGVSSAISVQSSI